MHELLANLNPDQQRAVTYGGGPLLVLAGPGSGKTRVLTSRIAYRIRMHGLDPRRILGVTFTNRAASEMRGRVTELLGKDTNVPLGTFHWMCHALLRRHIRRIGLRSDFRLLTPSESRHVLRRVIDKSKVGASSGRLGAALSAVRNGVHLRDASLQHGLDQNLIATTVPAYERELRTLNCLDLDDLLVLSLQLLREDEDVRGRCRAAYQEILADEYQDTNPIQHELLRLLEPATGSVVAVGDDDQSIYAWRQADVRNIVQFANDFPGTQIVRLEQTYRSTKHILRTAGALIRYNSERLEKTLHTDKPAGSIPVCFVAGDETEEAEWVVAQMAVLAEREGRGWNQFAVLYRVNAQSRAFEDALVRGSIPYQIAGTRFYDRSEIRRAAAYLRLAIENDDESAALLALSLPGVGAQRLRRLRGLAEETDRSLIETFEGDQPIPGIPAGVRASIRSLARRVAGVRLKRRQSLAKVLDAAIEAVRQELEDASPVEREAALDDLDELRSIGIEAMGQKMTLRGFVDRLALGGDQAGTKDGVHLMSLHAAKGLEFPVVFLAGLEEGLLPHRRSLDSDRAVEEERRLCYVGITRAMDHLYLSYAHARLLAGSAAVGQRSRFIGEMGPANLRLELSSRARPHLRLDSVTAGERVVHQRWREGTVVEVQGRGRDTLVTVEFDIAGKRRLQLCHAPLSRLETEQADVLAG